jgi:hypothetical protein
MFVSLTVHIHISMLTTRFQYTLLAMKSMASGDPVDMQRGQRWPMTDVKGVKVEFKPWEEDSDFSDQEEVEPPISGYDPVAGHLMMTP